MFFMWSLSTWKLMLIAFAIGFVVVFGFFYLFEKDWKKLYPNSREAKIPFWKGVRREPIFHLIWWAVVSFFIIGYILYEINWLSLVIYPDK